MDCSFKNSINHETVDYLKAGNLLTRWTNLAFPEVLYGVWLAPYIIRPLYGLNFDVNLKSTFPTNALGVCVGGGGASFEN